MRSYSTNEFLSKLSADELEDPTAVKIIGLAKPDDQHPATIHFSTSLACETWFPIPAEIIESIDHLKTVPCRDHQHPLVRVTFKRPEDGRQDVAFLLHLVSHLQRLLFRAHRVARSGRHSRQSAAPAMASNYCWVEEVPGGLEVCCIDDVIADIACTGMV
jgi:hypothetical protein